MTNNSSDSTFQSRCHVVLVNPEDSLNIGSVARAMANFGFCNLTIVNPSAFDRDKAAITARFAEFLLDKINFEDSLESALSSSTMAVAFSSQTSKYRRGHTDLGEWIQSGDYAGSSKLHLVFGPESSGLTLSHTSQCKTVVRLPTSEEFPSMNLSHAAAIVLCCLSMNIDDKSLLSEDMATGAKYQALDNLVRESGEKSGFFREGHRPEIEHVLQNIFRRASLTNWEMDVVMGLFGRFNKRS